MLSRRAAVAAICSVAAGLAGGCGGASAPSRSVPAASAQGSQTPLMSNSDTGARTARAQRSAAARGSRPARQTTAPAVELPRSTGQARGQAPSRPSATHRSAAVGSVGGTVGAAVAARPTPAVSKDDNNTAAASAQGLPDPCRLVSLSEARAISGGAISRLTEAPLGPTCIYSGSQPSSGVTLVVEPESYTQIIRHMNGQTKLVIRGHQSVCGRLGPQMLFVRLSQHQLLNVTAPCQIAQRFAALAMVRLTT